MAAIFVNYRNGAHAATVEALADQLRRHLGRDAVFLDMHSIPAGARYPDELRTRIAAARVVLVVVHPGWTRQHDEHGRRLIELPRDWVRLEIEMALHLEKLVIQVLLDTPPLAAAELPFTIRELANRQARPIRRGLFTDDVRRLAGELARLVPGLSSPLRRLARSQRVRVGVASAVVAVLLTVAGLVLFQDHRSTGSGSGNGGQTTVSGRSGEQRPDQAYLASAEFINASIDLASGSVGINGSTYDRSLVYNCATICVEPRASVEFDLGRQWRTLNVVAGVLDNAFEPDQVGHFEIYLDDRRLARVDATLRMPQELRLDVTNGLRLRLVAYRDGTVTDAGEVIENQARGISNKLPSLAWGDPRVS